MHADTQGVLAKRPFGVTLAILILGIGGALFVVAGDDDRKAPTRYSSPPAWAEGLSFRSDGDVLEVRDGEYVRAKSSAHWSPDGRRYARIADDGLYLGRASATKAAVAASETRAIKAAVSVEGGGGIGAVLWTADGRSVVALQNGEAFSMQPAAVWKVDVARKSAKRIYAPEPDRYVESRGNSGSTGVPDITRMPSRGGPEVLDIEWINHHTEIGMVTSSGFAVLHLNGKVEHIPALGPHGGVSWDPDGARVAASAEPPVKSTAPRRGRSSLDPPDPTRATDPRDVELAIFDRATAKRMVIPLRDAQETAWSPRGNEIAVATHDGVYLVDASDGSRRKVASGQLPGITWSPDGRRLVIAAFSDPNLIGYGTAKLLAYDVETRRISTLIDPVDKMCCLRWE